MRNVLIILVIASIMLVGCTIKSPAIEVAEPESKETNDTVENNYTDKVETDKVEETIQETLSSNLTSTNPSIETETPETTEQPEEIIIPEKQYKIQDIELSGRNITTYGEFPEEFVNSLEKILDEYPKNISIAAYSIDGSRAIVYNGNQEYFSACTVKIPWMIYLCREIDAGRVDKDKIITYESKHYHGGSGTIRKGSYGDQYSIEELITLCLSISDNVAYQMLVQEVIDRADFIKYIESLNLDRFMIPSYSIWCSNSIATDFLMIWEDVYNYFVEDTLGSNILKNACTNTQWNYGCATVKDFDYSHKSGDNWEPNAAHNDAGIIWSETPYLFAMFTKSEGNNYDESVIDKAMDMVHKEFSK